MIIFWNVNKLTIGMSLLGVANFWNPPTNQT